MLGGWHGREWAWLGFDLTGIARKAIGFKPALLFLMGLRPIRGLATHATWGIAHRPAVSFGGWVRAVGLSGQLGWRDSSCGPGCFTREDGLSFILDLGTLDAFGGSGRPPRAVVFNSLTQGCVDLIRASADQLHPGLGPWTLRALGNDGFLDS